MRRDARDAREQQTRQRIKSPTGASTVSSTHHILSQALTPLCLKMVQFKPHVGKRVPDSINHNNYWKMGSYGSTKVDGIVRSVRYWHRPRSFGTQLTTLSDREQREDIPALP